MGMLMHGRNVTLYQGYPRERRVAITTPGPFVRAFKGPRPPLVSHRLKVKGLRLVDVSSASALLGC